MGVLIWVCTRSPIAVDITNHRLQDPFPDMPTEAEWDETAEVGSIAIDQTLNMKALSVYCGPIGDDESLSTAVAGADRVVHLLDRMESAQKLNCGGNENKDDEAAQDTVNLLRHATFLLDDMELSIRIYALFNMGACTTSGVESLPHRIRKVKAHVLAPYTSINISEVELLLAFR